MYWLATGTWALSSSPSTTLHAADMPEPHSSVVGSRWPAIPRWNGSGNEPTTAGIESVAVQSCRSHHTRSPSCSAVAAAPFGASTPLT